jgi:hypothetical protein
MKTIIGALTLGVAAGVATLAVASPFDGTWKFNAAKSKVTGDSWTYGKTAKGYRYSNNATVAYDFAVDGKDYPVIADRTVSWTAAGKNAWDVTYKAKGVVVSKVHRALSADGSSMTVAVTEYRPDGTTATDTETDKRVSGGPGLAGTWKDVSAKVSSDVLKVSTSAGGGYVIGFPNFKESISGKLNGTPTAINGPTVPTGAMASYKKVSANRWDYSVTLKGKTYSQGTMTTDGKSVSRTTWVPGKKSEAGVEVYDRM